MCTSLGFRLAATAVTAVALLAGGASAQPGAPGADTRQRLVLPAAGRNTVLAEMRRMLESVNAILQGVLADDRPAIGKAARAAGVAMAADVDPQMMQALPPPFRQLGMQTHRGFDALADRIEAGGTRDGALADLARITNNCVACHAIYRLDESR
jgi:hypothetical protein